MWGHWRDTGAGEKILVASATGPTHKILLKVGVWSPSGREAGHLTLLLPCPMTPAKLVVFHFRPLALVLSLGVLGCAGNVVSRVLGHVAG